MKTFSAAVWARAAIVVLAGFAAVSQPAVASAQTAQSAVPPTYIPLEGRVLAADGQPRTGAVTLTLALYGAKDDVSPLFVENQTITLLPDGGYALSFGSTVDGGIPAEVFTANSARYLGITVEGDREQERMILVAVPYALKAADAQTLSGRSISDFVLVKDSASSSGSGGSKTSTSNTVTAEATTQNFVAKYADNGGTLTDSVMFDNGTNVGVGNTNPQDKMDVTGGIRLSGTTSDAKIRFRPGGTQRGIVGIAGSIKGTLSNDFAFFAESGGGISFMVNGTPEPDALRINANGNVGAGVSNPQDRLDVNGSIRLSGTTGDAKVRFRPGGVQQAIVGIAGSIKGTLSNDFGFFAEGGNGISFMVNGSPSDVMYLSSAGNVGIGTGTPTSRLTVAGNANVTGNLVVDGNLGAKYQDVAEWVDAREPLEPGTVVVVDPARANGVMKSARGYDVAVAGAVSPQPGLILGQGGPGKVMVAQSGRVKIKADARYGAIKPGDLLVTSPRAGYAMKSKPVNVGGASIHRPGTVLGKALEPLKSGTGEILVLLTLQ